jgi:predicted nucleic acid-binding protein
MKQLEGDANDIARELDRHARSVYVMLEPSAEEFELARALLLHDPQLGLRGPDALHLATVTRHGETLHTLDRTLLFCATARGVPATDAGVLPPSSRSGA